MVCHGDIACRASSPNGCDMKIYYGDPQGFGPLFAVFGVVWTTVIFLSSGTVMNWMRDAPAAISDNRDAYLILFILAGFLIAARMASLSSGFFYRFRSF